MKKNILKTQLLILFVLTLFSFTSFYFGNDLPDNYFTITSENSGNILSYYFFSLVKLASYFSGPWILIPFFIFSICHTFIYDKREYLVDVLNFFPLVFVSGSLSFLFFQDSLGFGLQYAFKNGFTTLWLSIYTAALLLEKKSHINKYQKAYHVLMNYWDQFDNDAKADIDKKLGELGI